MIGEINEIVLNDDVKFYLVDRKRGLQNIHKRKINLEMFL